MLAENICLIFSSRVLDFTGFLQLWFEQDVVHPLCVFPQQDFDLISRGTAVRIVVAALTKSRLI